MTHITGDILAINQAIIPEFKYLTCCLCGKEIDPKAWYSCYDSERYAHSACFHAARQVGHTLKTTKSHFKFA